MAQPARTEDPSLVPPPRVVDATAAMPRMLPTSGRTTVAPTAVMRATDAQAENMMSKRAGYVAPPPAPLTGPGTITNELGKLTFNEFDTTNKVAADAVSRVQKQPTMAGKVGAAAGSALMTVPALAMDAMDGVARKAMDDGLGATIRGVGDAARGFFGITDEPAKPALAAATPATPAAPAKAAPVKPSAATGPMSGSIPAASTPAATPAPAAGDKLYDAGMKYAEDLKRINQRLIDTGTVTGGSLPAMAPPSAPAAPFKPSVQSPFAGSTNKWDKMWNAQWNAAALKNAQQVGVQQQNAGINAFNADTQRKQVDMQPKLQADQQANAQKIAGMNADASMYGADKQLEGVAMTNATRLAIGKAAAAAAAAKAAGSEAPPTAVPLPDGGIVMVGQGGTLEYRSADSMKAEEPVRLQTLSAKDGEPIKDTSGATIGVRVTQNGVPGIQLPNGQVRLFPKPKGKSGSMAQMPTLSDD